MRRKPKTPSRSPTFPLDPGNRYVPSWLYRRRDIRSDDMKVAALILAVQKGAHNCCYLSQPQIAAECGLSRKTVNASIARLTCSDKARRTGPKTSKSTTYYAAPLVFRLFTTIRNSTRLAYRIPTDKDSVAWWFAEEDAGRSTTIKDLRKHKPESNLPDNALHFPADSTQIAQ